MDHTLYSLGERCPIGWSTKWSGFLQTMHRRNRPIQSNNRSRCPLPIDCGFRDLAGSCPLVERWNPLTIACVLYHTRETGRRMLPLKRTTWNFFPGAQLTFGPNAVTALAGIIERYGAERVFLITDPILDEAGAVAQARKAIAQTTTELHTFFGGEVEPTTDTVERTVEAAREFGPDLFVGLGGGSNMDLAKFASAVISNDCPAESLLGFDKVRGKSARLVCVPTTAGTGSEVSHAAVLKNSATATKADLLSHMIRPDVALVDPYMTLTCPPQLTAQSGMTALAHAIEACLVTNFFQLEEPTSVRLPYEGNNPLGDLYAEKAIALVAQHLKKAVEEPENLTARTGMSLAATLAGIAVSQCGPGLCRAIGRAIECASDNIAFGSGSGIALPETLRFRGTHRPAKVAAIATALNAKFAALPMDEAATAAIEFLSKLRSDIGLPTALSQIGIGREQLPGIAARAFSVEQSHNLAAGSPDESDYLAILKACF